ncbi:MAG: APA family basic amino acid/polyamine antiporter [Planctomycetota bacterium]
MNSERKIGLLGATSIGVGAIVGGGILALAGVAFATSGSGAIIAFGLNGIIAILTALSFAEMASKFPESGGTYTFSKKVLSVEAAFAVGWVVWFASIVAAVLYAIGFAHFATLMVSDLIAEIFGSRIHWLTNFRVVSVVAVLVTGTLATGMVRKASGGGHWPNIVKIVVFCVLILGGFWAISGPESEAANASSIPFFHNGFGGLIQAMGFSFIALQGFDLIAAVGGEVRDPQKNIPRAMLISLAIALIIYLPLLYVISETGAQPGQSIAEAAANDPEGIVAIAARNFLGSFGYWLVIIAAVLSMFSALQANLYAASRISLSMARDRTLPKLLSSISARSGTPAVSIIVTASVVCATIIVLPDVATAGAASSLIFLITFALAHWISILVRKRSPNRPPPFRAPFYPLVPVVGGLACLGLALFQGISVPSAGLIAVVWLGVGCILFLSLFAQQARVKDASSTAADPELIALRGKVPLVLVPIANPKNTEAMIRLANAMVPGDIGGVVTQTVVEVPSDWSPSDDPAPLERSQAVLREMLEASIRTGIRIEALTTVAARPMEEIARVARLHRCETVLLGLSEFTEDSHGLRIESLLSALNANVVVLRASPQWQLQTAERILIPVAGRGGHEHLLALLLGSLLRTGKREVTFLRVMPENTSKENLRRARRDLVELADDQIQLPCNVEVITDNNPKVAIAARADASDLVIVGVQRLGSKQKLFGSFTRDLANRTSCSIIVMSRRG